jgi:hypothetical protein
MSIEMAVWQRAPTRPPNLVTTTFVTQSSAERLFHSNMALATPYSRITRSSFRSFRTGPQTGILASLHYFGTELWAQSLGYESEASAEFIALTAVEHQYVDSSDDEPESSAAPGG